VNTITTHQGYLEALNDYETIARMIRFDQNEYKKSKLHELEKLLYDPHNYFHINRSSHNSDNLDFSSCFVALAAPSMEGKTQSAFVFEDVRPLYFPLSIVNNQTYKQVGKSEQSKTQNIYENYNSLTLALYCYANEDMIEIKNLYGGDQAIGASSIKITLNNYPSRVLGFLAALAEDARRPQVQNYSSWMRYHSIRPSFSFKRIRISDVKNIADLFKGFVLFLDEFVGTPWATYVRNFARAIGLTCLVANTNTKVANLVGSESISGASGFIIWSIVIISLGPSRIDIINQLCQLTYSIESIKKNSSDPGVNEFLNNFVNEQINYLRPGMAMFLSESIVQYAQLNQQNINLKDFLDNVLKNTAKKMRVRKFRNGNDLVWQCANIGLFLSESFEQSLPNSNNYSWFCQGFSFLQNHLYYLVNPIGNANWIFLTNPPIESSKCLQVLYSNILTDWTYERTFFDRKDTGTILSCLYLGFQSTITRILSRAEGEILQNPFNVFNAQNEKALKRNGNALEVSAAVSIIDASQHSFGTWDGCLYNETFSLSGQNGIDFIKNLLMNLINTKFETKKRFLIFKLSFVGCICDLANIFKRMHVPFIYSLNREDGFLDLLNSVSNSVYLKKFERTSDSEQIDGKFEFKLDGREQVAVVECKSRVDKISSTIIYEILKRSEPKNPKLILIFCDEISTLPTEESKLTNFCNYKMINVYKVERSINDGKNFINIVPFYEAIYDPEIICLIFESTIINNI
jgi:hypothetical protein